MYEPKKSSTSAKEMIQSRVDILGVIESRQTDRNGRFTLSDGTMVIWTTPCWGCPHANDGLNTS